MKVRIGFDVYKWSTPDTIYPTQPQHMSEKPAGATRYIVEVEIPDPANPDVVIEAEAKEQP